MPDPTNLAGRPGSTERLEAIMLRTEQVVAWREAGYLQRQIAQRLGTSRTTVMLIEKGWARGRFGYGGSGYWRSRKWTRPRIMYRNATMAQSWGTFIRMELRRRTKQKMHEKTPGH